MIYLFFVRYEGPPMIKALGHCHGHKIRPCLKVIFLSGIDSGGDMRVNAHLRVQVSVHFESKQS